MEREKRLNKGERNREMTLPKQSQIDTLQKRIKSVQKKYLSGGKEQLTKDLCSIIRFSVRKSWMRHPIKLLAVDMNTIPDMDDSTRTIWKIKCDRCGKYHNKNTVEVDHLKGEHSLTCLEDMVPFALSILDVTLDDLQVLCKPCHRIKTHAERYCDGDEELAELKLKANDWLDSKKSVAKQKEAFDKMGYAPIEYSNAKKRLALAMKIMEE